MRHLKFLFAVTFTGFFLSTIAQSAPQSVTDELPVTINGLTMGYKIKSEGLKPKVDADEFNLSLYYLAFYSKNPLGNKFFTQSPKFFSIY